MNITKVQKLLYIAYGVGLVAYRLRIVSESPRAWPYGPVFPNTRETLKDEDFRNITFEKFPDLELIRTDGNISTCVISALNAFGKYSAGQLTKWSHQKGSPWWRVVNEDENAWNSPIPDDYIYDYFSKIVKKRKDDE